MRHVTSPGCPGTSPQPTRGCCGCACPLLELFLLLVVVAAVLGAVLIWMGKTGAREEATMFSGAAKDLPQVKLKNSS